MFSFRQSRIVLACYCLLSLSAFAKPLFAKSVLPTFTFFDEYIIPAMQSFEGTSVGGLSGIEFYNGHFYLLSDDSGMPFDKVKGAPRFYKTDIRLNKRKIDKFEILKSNQLDNGILSKLGMSLVDPESLRIHPKTGQFIWSSEGSIKLHIDPAVFISSYDNSGITSHSLPLPSLFQAGYNTGPRNNKVFEGLAISYNNKGIWLAMEGALKQDDSQASLSKGANLRFSYFDLASQILERQFVYPLSKIPAHKNALNDAYRTIGVVEVLQINQDEFWVLERSFTSGLKNDGNTVTLYLVDSSNATDVKHLSSLKNHPFTAATKQVLLNLNDVKNKLGSKRIDNIEGMTFGPKLANGNDTLWLVSDNNFNQHGEQISQILVFEVGIKTAK